MIYFFYGEDNAKNVKKATTLVQSLLRKKPDASYFKLDTDSFNRALFEELLESSALFESKYLIYGNNLLLTKEYEENFEENLKRIKDSPHIFIFVEQKLSAPLLKKIKLYAEKIHEEKGTLFRKEFSPGLFSLTDALGEKNQKKIWKTLHEAYRNGNDSEEVFNILVWQTKMLLIAKKITSQKEADELGIKPFPFKKACAYAKNFTEKELQKLLKSFTTLIHEARFGKKELDLGIEYIILSL